MVYDRGYKGYHPYGFVFLFYIVGNIFISEDHRIGDMDMDMDIRDIQSAKAFLASKQIPDTMHDYLIKSSIQDVKVMPGFMKMDIDSINEFYLFALVLNVDLWIFGLNRSHRRNIEQDKKRYIRWLDTQFK